jgi:hypothetical protein
MKKIIDSIRALPIGKKVRFFLAILSELIVLTFLICYPSWFEVRRFILFFVIPPFLLPREMLTAFYFLYKAFKEDMSKISAENNAYRDSCVNIPVHGSIVTVDERTLFLVKEQILLFYSKEDEKHLGDRLFGYLLKSGVIKVRDRDPQGRESEYKKLMGNETKFSDKRYHIRPNEGRGIDKETLIGHLEKLYKFFNNIELNDAAEVVFRDLTTVKR